MASNYKNTNLTKKKVLGIIGLIVFCLVFIFSCMSSFFSVGSALVGTFGIMTFPLSIVFAFISLAKCTGFSYRGRVKPTALFLLATFSVLFTIHSIATYKALDAVVTFASMKPYLALSYDKVTLLGSFGSIFTALLSMLLGPMGTIVLFVVLATIFIGLFFDYQLYGKFEEPRVKKHKTKELREKVANSDKDVVDGIPAYSFKDSEVAHEVLVDASTYEAEELGYQTSDYISNSEVAHEIISDDEVDDFSEANPYISREPQKQITADFDFYARPDYPQTTNDQRRDFINATYGGSTSYQEPETTYGGLGSPTGFDFDDEDDDDEDSSILTSSSNDLYGESTFKSEIEPNDDELSEIFRQSEDDKLDDDFQTPDIFDNPYKNEISRESQDIFGFPKQAKPEFETKTFERNEVQNPFSNPVRLQNTPVQNQTPANPYMTPKVSQQNPFNQNVGLSGFPASSQSMPQQPPQAPIIKVPAKEQKPANNYGVNIGMTGIRYNPPPLTLLQTPKPDTGDYTQEQARKTAQLESSLQAFNINAKVVNIVRGPKITRFELSLPRGTSVKKIPQYEDDIAAALAAKTINIRAPIPGSPYVGIELENDTYSMVYQRELFESDAFQNSKDPLPIAIGKDISGEIIVKCLTDMTHLLIAGSTGSGKSVFIHNIVLSLIYKSSPEDVKLIMIDPKRVEFNRYNGLPHLVSPEVVMGAHKAINALKWCVKEMDRRYELMSKAGYNNIKPYNKSDLVKAGQFEKFPYIVIIVDELAEIMQANKKEAEACIQRITQLARACGMHMVLATQRPSVDIITGVIKNNIPSRVAFSLQSGIDSKTIINTVGAEKLLGRGDMLFNPTGTSVMPRLQASYATDDEIQKIIDYVKHNNIAKYDESIENAINAEQLSADDSGAGMGGDFVPQKDVVDGYFKTAVKICLQNGGASTSYLQRRLSIGYSRAAKIIDQMEGKGYIGRATGSKPRPMLITPEQFEQEFGESIDSVDY